MKKPLIIFALLLATAAGLNAQWGAVLSASRSSGVVYDTDAQAYFNAIVSNGGTISVASKGYANTWFLAAKAHSYFTKLKCFNLLMGDQLAAALVQYNGSASTSSVATNHLFLGVGTDYAEATGLAGNGSSKYLDTGFSTASLTAFDTSFSIYNRSSSANGGGHGIVSGSNTFRGYMPYSDNTFYADFYNGTSGQGRTFAAISAPYGFLVASVTSAFDLSLYRNGSSLITLGNFNVTTMPTGNIFVFAINSGGPTEYADCTLAGYFIGTGLSSGDVSSMSTDLNLLQTSLGRNSY